MKKGQMEIMGIAIVVIILSMVFLFVVKFVLFSKDDTSSAREFAESSMAANFLNTLQETNARECAGISFSSLYQDCAENCLDYKPNCQGLIECTGGTENIKSCEYIRKKTSEMLVKVFVESKVQYYFVRSEEAEKFTDASNQLFNSLPDGKTFDEICSGNSMKAKFQHLPAKSNPFSLGLFICEP